MIFFLCLLFTIIVHEFGHLFMALLCGVGVEAYSIGFGKPYLHIKLWGIDWRITPWLLGGYCQLQGEGRKETEHDFLNQTYRKKVLILLAGVTVNILTAFVCYLINYGNIIDGIRIDYLIMTTMFTGETIPIQQAILSTNANFTLVQLSFMSFWCGLLNLVPIPAMDGGYIWTLLLEKVFKQNFLKILNILNILGFFIATVGQIVFVIWYIVR